MSYYDLPSGDEKVDWEDSSSSSISISEEEHFDKTCGKQADDGNDVDEDDEDEDDDGNSNDKSNGNGNIWTRTLVHLDVDCFYCQCEEVEGPPDYRERPIAIGQKHIIVTANYIARSMGVKKLQLRTAALSACPSLLILEGSDLERYRKHARKIYLAFREASKKLGNGVLVKKGGMDEAFADLTSEMDNLISADKHKLQTTQEPFIFGDPHPSKFTSTITEDQSGAQTTVASQKHWEFSTHSVHSQYKGNKSACKRRLLAAAQICERIRQHIKDSTGFTTSMGISVSPLLAKLASDLKKPNSLNVLFPWRSASIILPMPLRKIPQLGSRTLKALKVCLQQYHQKKPKFWKCHDLCQLPLQEIKRCLKPLNPVHNINASDLHASMLMEKCRGLDNTRIVDDGGGLTKTVSVEDSFKRGTVLTKRGVLRALETLLTRLPILLDERRRTSHTPRLAFPTTLRLTARVVDPSTKGRRPFVTHSKQTNFDGKQYMRSSTEDRRSRLRKLAMPMLEFLVLNKPRIDLTRLNLATTNFTDLLDANIPDNKIESVMSSFSTTGISQSQLSQTCAQQLLLQQNPVPTQRCLAPQAKFAPSNAESINKIGPFSKPTQLTLDKCGSQGGKRSFAQITSSNAMDEIDQDVLAELPPAIQAEVKQMYKILPKQKRKTQTIDNFFHKQKSGKRTS